MFRLYSAEKIWLFDIFKYGMKRFKILGLHVLFGKGYLWFCRIDCRAFSVLRISKHFYKAGR